MECNSAKYMDTLESGQMHAKTEPITEEIVTNPRTSQPGTLSLHREFDLID